MDHTNCLQVAIKSIHSWTHILVWFHHLSLILHRSAHDFASVTLKRHSRKLLGENIWVLIKSVYFSQFDFRIIPDDNSLSLYTRVSMCLALWYILAPWLRNMHAILSCAMYYESGWILIIPNLFHKPNASTHTHTHTQKQTHTETHTQKHTNTLMQPDGHLSTLSRLTGIFECSFILSSFSLYIFSRWTFGRRPLYIGIHFHILLVRWHVNMVDSWNIWCGAQT
jgi:hypothetical protein